MVATILRGLRAARNRELSFFAPKPDFYPLCAVFGTAMSVVAYCSWRALAYNPDVHLTKEHKHDEMHESGITLSRAEQYYDSLFRKAWRARAEDADHVDTHIHL